MIKYLRVFFLTTFLCLLATTAFAATASAVPVVIALTPTTVVIALLAVLAGYVSQAVSSGSIFGIATLSPTLLPYLTLFGSFLTAFVQSILVAPAQDATGWFNALLAGLLALTGLGAGVVAHTHTLQPKLTRLAKKSASVLLLLVGLGSLVTTQTSCKAAAPLLSSIEGKILSDVEAGDSLQQIEGDVEKIITVSGPVGADVVLITNNALEVLVGLGIIPSQWLPTVNTYLTTLAPQVAAHLAAKK